MRAARCRCHADPTSAVIRSASARRHRSDSDESPCRYGLSTASADAEAAHHDGMTIMRRLLRTIELPEPILTTRGDFGDGLAELVAKKLASIGRHAHEPVLAIRVELSRHTDPAVARPVEARATVDFNGRQVHATAAGRTARDAIDVVVSRLVRQMDDRPHASRWRRRPARRRT